MSVYIKRTATNRECYHTESECVDLQRLDNPREINLSGAERMGLTECKRCAKDVDRSTHDKSYLMALREAAND